MRIRKNLKLSPQLFSSTPSSATEILQTVTVCRLNQSPWDVISFAQDSNLPEAEDSFTGNGSLGDSGGAVESSVASMMDGSAKLEDNAIDGVKDNSMSAEAKVLENNGHGSEDGIRYEKETKVSHDCQKTDGKGWKCKRQAREGHSFCDHHISLHRSYNTSAETAAVAKKSSNHRARLSRAAKKSFAAGSNSYEFYYYSGFGPSWGKRRGDGGANKNKIEGRGIEIADQNHKQKQKQKQSNSSSSQSELDMDEKEFDFLDDDDDDDDDDDEEELADGNGGGGKKRMRKPVKARSLKSLM